MNIISDIKAVIFDMDGLMIDSEPFWAKTDKIFLEGHSIPYTPEINLHIMGMGQREIMEYFKKEFGLTGDTHELIDERRELLYTFLLADVKLLEGVEEIVISLYKKGFPLAIATTGHAKEKVEKILEKVGLESYFSVIVSGDDVGNGKPAPDIYLKTAELLHVDPSVCLVFEDAPNGVKSGKAAGMTVYGINKDENIYQRLKEAGADDVFQSLK
jgi:HAD superfamily hydrolase (TIGR01509 family)